MLNDKFLFNNNFSSSYIDVIYLDNKLIHNFYMYFQNFISF